MDEIIYVIHFDPENLSNIPALAPFIGLIMTNHFYSSYLLSILGPPS